jgi:hypothetical protein
MQLQSTLVYPHPSAPSKGSGNQELYLMDGPEFGNFSCQTNNVVRVEWSKNECELFQVTTALDTCKRQINRLHINKSRVYGVLYAAAYILTPACFFTTGLLPWLHCGPAPLVPRALCSGARATG